MTENRLYEIKDNGFEYIGNVRNRDIQSELNQYLNKQDIQSAIEKSSVYRGGRCAVVIFTDYKYIAYQHTYNPENNEISNDVNDKYTCNHYFKKEM